MQDNVTSLLVNSLSLLLSFLPSPSCKAEKERLQGWWCWAEAEVGSEVSLLGSEVHDMSTLLLLHSVR